MSEKLKLSRMNINDLIDVSLFNADNVKVEGFSKNIVDELSEHTSTVATKDALGHIKIGEGLDVSEDGTVSVSDEGGASSEALDEHLSDKNNPHGVTKAQVGLPNVDNVKQASKTEFNSHVKSVGNYQEEGHLKLSNATNSQSSVSDGVAATPRAVKEAYDKAVSAENKADEAFQAGNKRKKEVVDGLLSVDESLPIKESSTWNDVVKAIPKIEVGAKKHFEIVPKGVTVVSGIPFEPQTIQILSSKNETINYGVVGAVLGRPFIISDKGDNIQVYFEGNSIRFNKPFSVEVYLDIYG